MINNIKKLLENIGVSFGSKIMLINPKPRDIIKEYSKSNIVRFIISPEGNYYIADASVYTHPEIASEFGYPYPYIDGFINLDNRSLDVRLYLKRSFETLGFDSYNWQDIPKKDLLDKFRNTDFYKNLKSLFKDSNIEGLVENKILPEQEDSFLRKAGNKLGREAAGLAGDVATGVLRGFSPIPAIAGLSKIAGETISNELVDYFDKLFGTKKYLKNKVRNNEYYDKNYYNKYGYNIPEIELPSQEYDRIKEYIIPALKKFGYKMKVIGISREDKSYLITLFPGNSIYPNMDTDRNPIVYPLPIDIFDKITDSESSYVFVYDWLKLFDIPIRGL